MSLHRPPSGLDVWNSPERAYVAVTMRLADRSSDLLVRHVRILRDCVASAQKRWVFDIEAAVVLPGELHLLCDFPDVQFGVSGAVRMISRSFARHAPAPVGPENIWCSDSEVVEIPDDSVGLRIDMIENEPVRAGLVKMAADWPYSSAQKGVAQAGRIGLEIV